MTVLTLCCRSRRVHATSDQTHTRVAEHDTDVLLPDVFHMDTHTTPSAHVHPCTLLVDAQFLA